MPDKNKLSRSEKSLKAPLKMFQEEQRPTHTGNQFNLAAHTSSDYNGA